MVKFGTEQKNAMTSVLKPKINPFEKRCSAIHSVRQDIIYLSTQKPGTISIKYPISGPPVPRYPARHQQKLTAVMNLYSCSMHFGKDSPTQGQNKFKTHCLGL
jgi:hypothetical protein